MVLQPDQERVQGMLRDTITLLCKNGLTFKNKFTIDATIGVTIDENDVFLVSMKEMVQSADALKKAESRDSSDSESRQKNSYKRKKRIRGKRKKADSDSSDGDSAAAVDDVADHSDRNSDLQNAPKRSNIKVEEEDLDDSNDIVFVKQEMEESWTRDDTPQNNENNFLNFGQSQEFTSLSDMTLMPYDSSQDTSGVSLLGGPHSSVLKGQSGVNVYAASQTTGSEAQSLSGTLGDGQLADPGLSQSMGLMKQLYQCSMCEKRYTMKGNLCRHEKSHYGIYPYKCPYCGRGFYVTERMQKHILTAHVESSTDNIPCSDQAISNVDMACSDPASLVD